jgi:hypothetical protein
MTPSNVKAAVAFGAGFASGWVARSLADSPHDAGVKLVALALRAKAQITRWASSERERLEDVVAEAQTKVQPKVERARAGKVTPVRVARGEA